MSILYGRANIQVIQHIVDCDADPFILNGWKVEQHIKGGKFIFDLASVFLYLSKKQQNGGYILGDDLRKELRRKPILNANVLDYLLAHPEIIPEEWKKNASGNTRYIFFWGTIYRDSDGSLYVRSLYFSEGRWFWSCRRLDLRWHGSHPAVVVAPAS